MDVSISSFELSRLFGTKRNISVSGTWAPCQSVENAFEKCGMAFREDGLAFIVSTPRMVIIELLGGECQFRAGFPVRGNPLGGEKVSEA